MPAAERTALDGATTFLFDLDGTLLDSRAAVIDAVAEGLRRAYVSLDLPAAEPDRERLKACMGLPSDDYFRRSYDPATVPADRAEEFATAYGRLATEAEVAALDRGETALFPDVVATLAELRRRGHRLLLFSNAQAPYFAAVIRAHGLDAFFADTLCLEDARRLGVADDKAGLVRHLAGRDRPLCVVGDREHDVAAGRAAGAWTVGCAYGFGDRTEFEAADWIVDGLAGILDLPPAAPRTP